MRDALQAIGLTKTYGSGANAVTALDDVSLTLARGTVSALLGPSGAGKSTLIKALGFVSPAQRGEVFFEGRRVVKDGVPLADLPRLRRHHLGFVFQKANLTSFLTARENVEIACELGEKPHGRQRARELLAYLEVGHRERAYPETLSGGEQQRVAIARALANEPSLILADEPTAALDSLRSRLVMELFRKVAHERGTAVLVVTHDHRALDVFDALYEMEDGRIRRAEHPAVVSAVHPPAPR
ncbi:MAG: ABC transporter ATP-binding protein [Deltaproteobacteria bacterium]|nr:ABC transporter ATP-binding protein [Deltaproteobacteria bacterium]